jgi:hypothetical protein
MSPDKIKQILKAKGTETEVGVRFGVHGSCIGKIRRKHGIYSHGMVIQKYKAEVIELRKSGLTYEAICAKVGHVSTTTAFNWCTDAGLPKVKKTYRTKNNLKQTSAPKVAEWITKALAGIKAA